MSLNVFEPDVRDDVERFLFAIADDEFFTANRLARWVGSGPTLEEDNALSSILQDELGHARLWLELLAEDRDETISELAQTRPADERRHSNLVEPAYTDFGETIVRSFLYDWAERRLYTAIRDGDVEELAARASIILDEEHYHREHAERWFAVLTSTEEGRHRIEEGFVRNVPRARDYFAFDADLEDTLVEHGVLANDLAHLRAAWIDDVASDASSLDLDLPDLRELLSEPPERNGRAGDHTSELPEIVDNLYPTKDELYPDHTDMDGDIRYGEKVGLR